MDVFTNVIKAKGIGCALAHRQRPWNLSRPAAQVFAAVFRWFVTPWIEGVFPAALRSLLPLGLRGQSVASAAFLAQPAAVFVSLKPGYGHHRLVGMIQVRVLPFGRSSVAGRSHKRGPVPVTHLENGHLKGIDPHAMDGLFVIPARGATHLEVTGGNQHTTRLSNSAQSHPITFR